MKISLKFVFALLLLSIVAIIFISPAVDLEPTALRALQFAYLLFALLAWAGITVFSRLVAPIIDVSPSEFPLNIVSRPSPFDLNCTRLC